MAKVLVTGGSGVLGSVLLPKLLDAGHAVRSASRRPPRDEAVARRVEFTRMDLVTGAGEAEAVTGIDVIIHAASVPVKHTRAVDVEGTRRLLERAKTAGVKHFIYISIVGIERVPYTYYRLKVEAERIIRESGVPYTILRASQFPELFERVLEPVSRLPVLLLPTDFRFQPIDTGLVADRLVLAVADGPRGMLPDFAGPEVLTVGQIARAWLRARGMRRPIVHLPLPGKVAAAFRAGAVTSPGHAQPGPTLYEWLERKYRRSGRPEARSTQPQRAPAKWAQWITALVGLSFVLTGAALLFAPLWFFHNVGTFPPFNRHYAGDLGAFTLPLGIGLMWAARDPWRHRLLVAVAALGSLLHVANHAVDHLADGASLLHWLTDMGPLALGTVLLGVVLLPRRVKRTRNSAILPAVLDLQHDTRGIRILR